MNTMNFVNALENTLNRTRTENGAATLYTTGSDCLDFFSTAGAMRHNDDESIWKSFFKAYCENPSYALKILFYARDIRGGLGERKIFRTILQRLADQHPNDVLENLKYISEYGRWDDYLCLLDTKLKNDVADCLFSQFRDDLVAIRDGKDSISLIGKWLPSINTSSKETVRYAKILCRCWHLKTATYRKALSTLRKKIEIIENNLREKDYTFDYSKQPSRAMLKYRDAFIRNDKNRYIEYLESVNSGKTTMHTGTLYPYDIVRACNELIYKPYDSNINEKRKSLDTTWRALKDYTRGKNALCVVDGSGSMYSYGEGIRPIDVAVSLGIYFAERNRGQFQNKFITFSENPRLVNIPKDVDIVDKVKYCFEFNEVADTNIQKVFELILETAVKYHIPQNEMPETVYIVSDMEWNVCTYDADMTNFEYAKKLYERNGYRLPQLVFWNVNKIRTQHPVHMNELGVALVSGCSPSIFELVMTDDMNPKTFMDNIILSERYEPIHAWNDKNSQ